MTEKTITQVHGVTRNIISESPEMQAVFRYVKEVAPTKATVLITGETGVGKEIVAQAIHDSSPRRKGPFKMLNCGAIPTELIQSELFGNQVIEGSVLARTYPDDTRRIDNAPPIPDGILPLVVMDNFKLVQPFEARTDQPRPNHTYLLIHQLSPEMTLIFMLIIRTTIVIEESLVIRRNGIVRLFYLLVMNTQWQSVRNL